MRSAVALLNDAKRVEELHRLATETADGAIRYAIECGQALAAIKSSVGHGNFQAWCEGLTFSIQTARTYMRTAEAASKRKHAFALSIRGLLKLVASENKTSDPRAERIAKIAEISAGNEELGVAGRYPVLYVDPPWRYEHVKTESRAIENQYPTMSLDEIKALPIDDVAFDDCVMFMWATSPKLAEAFEVLKAWNFSYRTCAVWDKQKIGMGYYFRQQHELLLVAVRGEPPAPAPADRPSSVFSYPRGKHSAKPVEVYEVIEAMYPTLPKLELFSRSKREGWGAWGNQVEAA